MPGLFRDGNIIILHSVNSGKNLKITKSGHARGDGGNNKRAQFLVHKCSKGVIKLQNVDNRDYWLRINKEHHLDGRGGGGPHCQLKIVRHGHGVFSFESKAHPGCHVGIKPDGCAKPAHNTGRGEASRFRVTVHHRHGCH